MYAKISGKVVGVKIQTPEGKKPFQQISILQLVNDTAEVVRVKDYDLNRRYADTFDDDVQIFPWAMNGKNGVALTRIEGNSSSTLTKKRDLG